MKPRVNNPGWVQAIQDVIDLMTRRAHTRPTRSTQDPNGTAFEQFLAGTGSTVHVVGRRGLERPHL